jgi:Tfp pilus assembly protein PilN
MSMLSGRSESAESIAAEAPAPVVDEAPIPSRLVILARVNLMPNSYARRAAVHRAKMGALAALLGAMLVAGLMFLVSWQKATSAQEQLDQATFERTQLQIEAARYAGVPLVFEAVNGAQGQLVVAMGNEVRWSFFLNDLALTMPAGVSLDTLEATVIGPGQSAGTTGDGQVGGKAGTLSVAAKALTFNSVANWLDSLAKMDTVADPYVSGLSRADVEGTKVVTFSSTADITTETLSGRYTLEETP